ncbi:MAG TPA: M20/M25/M40 family metallo-hydrolase, partial [Firmicutes bacterium]|nr:M20/M25/M40 family metallo-hydrolase [Bacillota bacterium]
FECEGIAAFMFPQQSSSPVSLSPNRPNLVAILPGGGSEDPVLLVSHLDSVSCRPDEWIQPRLAEGRMLYGPGALDGIHLTVAHAMAIILLARRGDNAHRTVRFAATSDGAGGKATGLNFLARENLEYISGDIALAWGGLNWNLPDGSPCSLLTTAEKGVLRMKLRSEGGGGGLGIGIGVEPAERLVKALHRIGSIKFKPVISKHSIELAESTAELFEDPVIRSRIEGLADVLSVGDSLKELMSDENLDKGLKALLKACVSVERTVIRLDASAGDGQKPRVAEAELVYCFPPGADAEEIAIGVLDTIGTDGVYLAEKSLREPSEGDIENDIAAVARAAMVEIDPRAKLVRGISPFPTGFHCLRELGMSVCGWEPFAAVGSSLADVLEIRPGASEMIEMNDLMREVQAIYSFLCRIG